MIFNLKIALRNIFRNKRRTFFTILTFWGGFTFSALAIGWSDGTYSKIIDMFTRNRLGHIQLHKKDYLDKPSLYKTITLYEKLEKKILSLKEVESFSPRLYSSGLASFNEKSASARIIGIDPQKENQTTHFSNKIIEGTSFLAGSSQQVVIGKSLAGTLKAGIGAKVVIISQAADGSIANDIYTVAGIIETGDLFTDRTAFYLTLSDAQELLSLHNSIHEAAVIIDNIRDVKKISETIQTLVDDSSITVEPWQEFAKTFYQAMKADQKGMWISLFIIIFIVAIGVLNTVLMTVLERTREYGLLKAIGTRPAQIIQLILYEINILAVISILAGAVSAFIINYVLSIYGIPMPTPLTYGGMVFDRLYTEINARSFIIPLLAILITATLVGIFPAAKAARIAPAKAMRSH